jgi:hypothetical protein
MNPRELVDLQGADFTSIEGRAVKLQIQEDAAANFDAMCERITLRILGKDRDPSPGVDWHCNRSWKISKVRELVRAALESELLRDD